MKIKRDKWQPTKSSCVCSVSVTTYVLSPLEKFDTYFYTYVYVSVGHFLGAENAALLSSFFFLRSLDELRWRTGVCRPQYLRLLAIFSHYKRNWLLVCKLRILPKKVFLFSFIEIRKIHRKLCGILCFSRYFFNANLSTKIHGSQQTYRLTLNQATWSSTALTGGKSWSRTLCQRCSLSGMSYCFIVQPNRQQQYKARLK